MLEFDETDIKSYIYAGILAYKVKRNDIDYYHTILQTLPSSDRTIEIDGKLYLDERYISLESDETVCSRLSKETLDKVIKDAIVFITGRGMLLNIFPEDKYLKEFVNRNEHCEFVKDVDTLPYDGQIDLSDEVMQKLCIEKPVRKACKYLSENGINTIMSSANKYNVESKNKSYDENKLYIGQDDSWVIGNGYAWIMIDWNELNNINKNLLVDIIKCNKEFVKFYEYIDVDRENAAKFNYDHSKIIESLGIEYQTGENDYDDYKNILFGNNSLNNYNLEEKHCRFKTVVLRYPVDETTRVSEVEDFFLNVSKQIVENNKKDKPKQLIKKNECFN